MEEKRKVLTRADYSQELIDKFLAFQNRGKDIFTTGRNMVSEFSVLEKAYIWAVVTANILRAQGNQSAADEMIKQMKQIELDIVQDYLEQ